MVTPFTEDGEVDIAQAQRLAKALIASGSDGLVVTGTTGESPTLEDHEKKALWTSVKEAVGENVPVVAGSTNYATAQSIRLTQDAAACGVDGILMVVPYYNNPPQEGLYRHFRAVAESISLPCILYNVPSRTVRNMEAATTIRLMRDVPNIVGIKEASGNFEQIAAIIEAARKHREDFRVWSGNDQDTFLILCVGGWGVVSVASHLKGLEIQEMIKYVRRGKMRDAQEYHLKLLPLAKALFPPASPVASPSAIKAALNLLGFPVGGLRLPLIELDEHARRNLTAVLEDYSLDLLPLMNPDLQ